MKISLVPEFHSVPLAKEYIIGQIKDGGVLFVEFPEDSASYKDNQGKNILEKLNHGEANDTDLEKFCGTTYENGGHFRDYIELFRFINEQNQNNHGKNNHKIVKVVPVDADTNKGWLITERYELTKALANICISDEHRADVLDDVICGRNYRYRLGIPSIFEAVAHNSPENKKLREYAFVLQHEIQIRQGLKAKKEKDPNYGSDESEDKAMYDAYMSEDFWKQKLSKINKNEFVGKRDHIMAENIKGSKVQGEPRFGIFGAAHIEGIKNKLGLDRNFQVDITIPMRDGDLENNQAYNYIRRDTKIVESDYKVADITSYKDLQTIRNEHSSNVLAQLENLLGERVGNRVATGNIRQEPPNFGGNIVETFNIHRFLRRKKNEIILNIKLGRNRAREQEIRDNIVEKKQQRAHGTFKEVSKKTRSR